MCKEIIYPKLVGKYFVEPSTIDTHNPLKKYLGKQRWCISNSVSCGFNVW